MKMRITKELIEQVSSAEEIKAIRHQIALEETRIRELRDLAWRKQEAIRFQDHIKLLKSMIGQQVCLDPKIIRIGSKLPSGMPAILKSVGRKKAVIDFGQVIAGYKLWNCDIKDIVPYTGEQPSPHFKALEEGLAGFAKNIAKA